MSELSPEVLRQLAVLMESSPTSIKLFLTLLSYHTNTIITNTKTLARLMNIEKRMAQYCVRFLVEHELITVNSIYVNYAHDVFGVVHDKDLYYKSNKTVWKKVGEKYIDTLRFRGKYMEIMIPSILNIDKKFLLHLKHKLYLDTPLQDFHIERK